MTGNLWLLPLGQVEPLVMKALSLGLVKGGRVHVKNATAYARVCHFPFQVPLMK